VKVPHDQKFQGTKVLGTFAPSSTGVKVPRSESSWTFCSSGAKVLSVDFSLPGMKVQKNE